MSKKSIIAAAVLVAAIASGAVWWSNSTKTSQSPLYSNDQQSSSTASKATTTNDGKTITYAGVADKTALEQLKTLTTTETKSTSFGDMVVSINGLKAEDTKNYWAFYVNDQYANEGAGTYKMKQTDTIQWRLEAIQ
ncbi:MAG: DUF4430 domain-containing protein [Candidatus Saccharimonadales bacterium]